MYGTDAEPAEDKSWTILKENRGGSLYFPTDKNKLSFDKTGEGKDQVVMWLGIRNYLRFTDDLRLEVCDYSFTGFKISLAKRKLDL
jgi:hypothetical protein